MVIVMIDALKEQFKPYELDFIEWEDVMDKIGVTDEDVMDIFVELECSKSIDETCANFKCEYNMIDLHNDELYIKLSDGGD